MTPTMRRLLMAIGLLLTFVPMAIYVVSHTVTAWMIVLLAGAAVMAGIGLWMSIYGRGYNTGLRVSLPVVTLVLFAGGWFATVQATPPASSQTQASTNQSTTLDLGYYTDEVTITPECKVIKDAATKLAVIASPDDLGRGCKIEVDVQQYDLYISRDATGELVDGDYAPDYRTYVFVALASPQLTLYAFHAEDPTGARVVPDESFWNSTIVGRTTPVQVKTA